MPITRARGGKSPIRPGLIFKEALLRNGPMSITALHGEYREQVKAYNAQAGALHASPRPAGSYNSTEKVCYKLKRLGLIVYAGTEPMEFFPGPVNKMLSIRVSTASGSPRVIMSERILYEITDAGKADIEAWESPSTVFMERIHTAGNVMVALDDRDVAPAPVIPRPVVVPRPTPRPRPVPLAPTPIAPKPTPKPVPKPTPKPAPPRPVVVPVPPVVVPPTPVPRGRQIREYIAILYGQNLSLPLDSFGPDKNLENLWQDVGFAIRDQPYKTKISKVDIYEFDDASGMAVGNPVSSWDDSQPEPLDAAEEEQEETSVTQEIIDQLTERWLAVVDRVSGWQKPNSGNATKLMDKFVEEIAGDDTLGVSEDDLDGLISDAREKLQEYQDLDRADYDDNESYSEGRAEAWQEFVDSLQVDFGELGGE